MKRTCIVLLNKILPLKKIKSKYNLVKHRIKKYHSILLEIENMQKNINLLLEQKNITQDEIENFKLKHELYDQDFSNLVYSISILNLIIENIIYGDDDLLGFKNKIKYH